MPLRVVTPPAAEPVTASEAKSHLRLEHALDDAYITTLIQAARQYVEQVCWRGLVTQTLELIADAFPVAGLRRGNVQSVAQAWGYPWGPALEPSWQPFWGPGHSAMELPWGTLSSVTWVKYIDDAGVEQTLPTSDYSVDTSTVPGRILLGFEKSWPTTRYQWDAVKVRYVVGWSPTEVPAPVKQAILLLVSQMYEHRTPEVIGATVAPVQFAFDALVGPYRLARW